MNPAFRSALAVVAVVAGCSSGGTSPPSNDAVAEASSEGGPREDAESEAGAVCIATGNACGPATDPCVGDCRGRTCCSGLCALDTCSEKNVTGGTCPTGCGGNPEGTWHLVGACHAGACSDTKQATVVGKQDSWVVSATSGTTLDWGYAIHCGAKSTAENHSINGTWLSSESTIGGHPYCVRLEGSTLWVMAGDSFALKFTR